MSNQNTTTRNGLNLEQMVQTIDALIAFLQDPTSITVTITPDEAVPLHQLIVVTQINPVVLVELLNLEVTAGD